MGRVGALEGLSAQGLFDTQPRGSIYTTILELGPQNHNGDGLLGANSIIVVYMDPLGKHDQSFFLSKSRSH